MILKKVKLISVVLSMLIGFIVKAQEKTTFKEHTNQIPVVKVSAKNEPLYILDGVVITSKQFSKVNPNDIENIKVLKGIDATSLYGSQGINGVIIITTKDND